MLWEQHRKEISFFNGDRGVWGKFMEVIAFVSKP